MSSADAIEVGDSVRVQYGARTVEAEVLEDRGPLGVGGERLLRVGWTPDGSDEPLEFEIRASRVFPGGMDFEEQVLTVLERLQADVQSHPQRRGAWRPDALIRLPDGELVVLEAKAFPGGAAPRVLAQTERQLLAYVDSVNAHEALLVVPSWDPLLIRRERRPGVSIVPIGQLEDWLSERLA